MIKNKGQIVPKRLIRAVEKKSQHLVKFGCKCEVINNKVIALEPGPMLVVPSVKYCNTKKNKRRTKGYIVGKRVELVGVGHGSTLFQIDLPHREWTVNYDLQN